jgi:hypothetical protein
MATTPDDIKKEDFVTLNHTTDDVEVMSVGLVLEVIENEAVVFFIGRKKQLTIDIKDVTFLDLAKTDKPYEVKICNICHILKNNSDFDINQTDAKGRKTTRPSCKVCRIVIDGVDLKKEESMRLEKSKPHLLFSCPICEKMSIPNVTAKVVKDHDHDTGLARDWICDSCNTGLGRFKDDTTLLYKAIAYLEKYKKSS